MKTLGLFLALTAVFFVNNLSAQRIYKVTSPSEATFKALVVNSAADCDLKVFETTKPEEVVKDGTWYQTQTASEADLKVYITTDQAQADVKIFYVSNLNDAGWVTTDKRHFFKVQK